MGTAYSNGHFGQAETLDVPSATHTRKSAHTEIENLGHRARRGVPKSASLELLLPNVIRHRLKPASLELTFGIPVVAIVYNCL